MSVAFCSDCNGAHYGDLNLCTCRWRSVVEWPEEVSTGRSPNVSTDEHRNKESAEYVCKRLEKEGMGLEGKLYPISTRVEQVKEV